MTRPQTASFDDTLRDRERVERAVHRLWDLDDSDVLSVSHGDPHVGNTYRLPNGAVRFLDWQTVCLAPWIDDVAYFLVGPCRSRRRAPDADLLRLYLSRTRNRRTGSRLRRGLAGLPTSPPARADVCALPPEMQPAEICTLMGERYAAAAIDHETLLAVELSSDKGGAARKRRAGRSRRRPETEDARITREQSRAAVGARVAGVRVPRRG